MSAAPTITDFRAMFLSGTPLIDVRAPVEFSKGAFPGAVNLPLMTDDERHLVGVRYTEQGQDSAIKLGAELVGEEQRALRTARWQDYAKAHPDGALYCFRGGLRSRISQQWLSDAGCDYPLVEGGYKALRRWMIDSLEALCASLPFVLVGGRTGTGKTLLIEQLGRSVDLEGIARHRGSSFGGLPESQPSNIDFENAVGVEMLKLSEMNPTAAVYLEDEARLIGRVCLPESLRNAMQESPAIVLETPMEERIDNCLEDYVVDLYSRYVRAGSDASEAGSADTDLPEGAFERYAQHHRGSLARIQRRFGGENYKQAAGLLHRALEQHRVHHDTTLYRPFIEMLLTQYYDPMYDYQISEKARRVEFIGDRQAILQWAQR